MLLVGIVRKKSIGPHKVVKLLELSLGLWNLLVYVIGYGVTANIIASHAIARGSIPRIRTVGYS